MNHEVSLYEKLGGQQKVQDMLQVFYQRVLMDADLAPFFERSDINKLIAMQQEFFSIALGGPVEYPSRRLIAAHHGRGIARKHFTRFCEHLIATLEENGVDSKDIDRILVRLGTYAGNVTGDVGVDG